jgi:hypothetical protein
MDFGFAATDVTAMLWRLDALLAQSRVLSTEHEAVLNEAEALITIIGDLATRLDAATEAAHALRVAT